MTQQAKKPAAQATAKLAPGTASKAARSGFAAVESTRASAENVVKIGASAVKEMLENGAQEAQKAQKKMFAMGQEGAENIVKSADVVTKMLYEGVSMSRENIETCIECGNIMANLAKEASEEMFEYANRAFSDSIEVSKEAFACRTFNDMFELQSRLTRQSLDNFFNQSVRLSSLCFDYANQALEPINERVAQAAEQMGKALAA